jgi:branched-subunit amino acid aminotransferase/4-amino-4-deoxychorismate lyase
MRRLVHDAGVLGMDISSDADVLLSRLEIRIAGEDLSNGRARITISDKRASPLWPSTARNAATSVTVQTGPLNEAARPFRLGVSKHLVNSTSALAGLKTCNYLEQILAFENAAKANFNEAVRLNERGHVTSACMANIFWLKDEKLYTPALSTGCLPGTMREFVLENVDVTDVAVGVDELRTADAIFLTSAGLGVVAVDEFDGRAMQRTDHPILALIPGR